MRVPRVPRALRFSRFPRLPRLPRSLRSVRASRRLAAALLVAAAAGAACPAAGVLLPDSGSPAHRDQHRGRPSEQAVRPEHRPHTEAECRTSVKGSSATAECHNPYPDSDRVQLHIECDRWWDPDWDSAPVAADPALTVELRGRCWMGIREAWVSHSR